MSDDSGWCTIESSAAVFSEILEEIGVKNIQVDEAYSLDSAELQRFGRVYGIIFLFHHRGSEERELAKNRHGIMLSDTPPGLFFANQTIQNACATQAILSVILNLQRRPDDDFEIGSELAQFKQFTEEMDPMTKGMVLSNSETIRAAHNSFASQQQLVVDDIDRDSKKKEDAFHFVSYIPWNQHVYELDGLQEGPRDLGSYTKSTSNPNESWIDVVAKDVSARVEEYSKNEIRFGLLVVTEDIRAKLQMKIDSITSSISTSEQNELIVLRNQLLEQNEKRAVWRKENARRKWNFMPFIIKFLKLLAETGHIEKIIDEAGEKKKEEYQKALKTKHGASSSAM